MPLFVRALLACSAVAQTIKIDWKVGGNGFALPVLDLGEPSQHTPDDVTKEVDDPGTSDAIELDSRSTTAATANRDKQAQKDTDP